MYMHLSRFVQTFDSYGDVWAYAIENGWDIDEKGGFEGMVY